MKLNQFSIAQNTQIRLVSCRIFSFFILLRESLKKVGSCWCRLTRRKSHKRSRSQPSTFSADVVRRKNYSILWVFIRFRSWWRRFREQRTTQHGKIIKTSFQAPTTSFRFRSPRIKSGCCYMILILIFSLMFPREKWKQFSSLFRLPLPRPQLVYSESLWDLHTAKSKKRA